MGATEGLTNLLFSYLMSPSRGLGGVAEGHKFFARDLSERHRISAYCSQSIGG